MVRPAVRAQDATPAAAPATTPRRLRCHSGTAGQTENSRRIALTTDAQKNLQAYVELLRANVRQEKAQMMGAVMQLSAADAAKFWPIYSDYNISSSR